MELAQVAGLKRCKCCSVEKDVSDFPKASGAKPGFRPDCKACHNAKNKAYRLANPDKAAESGRKWAAANPEKVRAKKVRWNKENAERVAEQARRWRKANPDKAKAAQVKSNRKRNGDVAHRLRKRVAEVIRITLTTGKGGRKTFDILGYTAKQLTQHLERQFLAGMSWKNYGDWHIDHITPLKLLPYASVSDDNFKAAWCLSNLRPLWALDNAKKRDKRTHLI